jgi:DNA-directed RNA polymerase specialized sigma24 family protein
MSSSNLRDLSDETLVGFICRRRPPHPRRIEAGKVLTERYQRKLCGHVRHAVARLEQFLSAVRCGCLEHFAADVLGKAIRTWRRGRGTKFSTWLYGLLTNEIVSGKRLKRPPLQARGRDGEDLLGDIEAPGGGGRGIEKLALAEAVDLARACLLAMDGRRRRVFVWACMLGMSNEEIRGIWPHESAGNIKQIKHRAAAQFLSLWQEKGGGSAQEIYQTLAGTMAEKVDPGEIRDPRARRAYRLWVKKGSLAGAAREMKVAVPRLRKMILEGLEELFEQVFRGEAPEARAPGKREDELARYLSLAEGGRPGSPVFARLERTLDFVRAAFGFAPREAAAETLGSRLQSRLRREEDYDRACSELGLGAAGLRELLADEYEPERSLFGRLSRFLGVPAARLRALPRRPAREAALMLRSDPGFDEERFRERVMEWIEGKTQ